jgi:hypothetical protein
MPQIKIKKENPLCTKWEIIQVFILFQEDGSVFLPGNFSKVHLKLTFSSLDTIVHVVPLALDLFFRCDHFVKTQNRYVSLPFQGE